MGIQVGGIKLTSLDIRLDDADAVKLTGNYKIMTKNNTVLATQSFNGYSSDNVKLDCIGHVGEAINKAMTTAEKKLNTLIFGDEKL